MSILFKLNRTSIQKALQEYEASRQLHNDILNDREIQAHYRNGNDILAKQLTKQRYPNGDWQSVIARGVALVEAMTSGINEYEHIDPIDIWRNHELFSQFVLLAKQV